MPVLDPVTNFGIGTVSTGYSSGATSIVLTSGHGARFPDPGVDGAFNFTWWNSTDYSNPADDPNKEICRCTVVDSTNDIWTITRAQEGTAATNKNTGGKTYKVMLGPTKKFRDDLEPKLSDARTPTAHGASLHDSTVAPFTSRARAIRTTNQIIPTGTATQITFTAEEYDGNNNFAADQFVAPVTGGYLIMANLSWASNTVGYRLTDIRINGVRPTPLSMDMVMASSTSDHVSSGDLRVLNANDTVQLWGEQASGGDLTVTGWLSIVRLW